MQAAEIIIIILLVGSILVGLPIAALCMRRKAIKAERSNKTFAAIATQLGLVPSGVANNDDYAFFYDAFTLSGDSPIWQTTSKPRIYLNPNRQHGAELLVKGTYNLPSIKLESKHNSIRIQHLWGSQVPMQTIRLEGDFNNYFTLYCEAGQEVIALQILNPEIMQQMITQQLYYDVQIQGAAIMLSGDVKQWSEPFTKQFIEHAVTLDGLVRATKTSRLLVLQPSLFGFLNNRGGCLGWLGL